MNVFEREQLEILKLSDKVRYEKSIHTTEKHHRYVEIVKNYLEKYVSSNFELVEHSYLEEFPGKFHLIMVKKDSRPVASEKTPCYRLEAIAAVIEIRGSGLVNYKDRLEEDVKAKRTRFEDIKAINKNIKCLYLTLQEREITKGTNYDQLSKKHLGSDYFCLRESTTQTAKAAEWKRFVRALLGP